ncbi:MAG: histidine phosphatase family protein [Thermoplasmataceae archaeon]
MTQSKTVFLIRHARTESNKTGIWRCGKGDPILPEGKEEILRASRTLKDLACSTIMSSEMVRAVQTASLLSLYTGISLGHAMGEFNERGCGAIDGLTYDDIYRKYGFRMDTILTEKLDSVPGAESLSSFTERVIGGLEKVAVSPVERPCIVTHGGVMALIKRLYGNDSNVTRFQNCSVLPVFIRLNESHPVIEVDSLIL